MLLTAAGKASLRLRFPRQLANHALLHLSSFIGGLALTSLARNDTKTMLSIINSVDIDPAEDSRRLLGNGYVLYDPEEPACPGSKRHHQMKHESVKSVCETIVTGRPVRRSSHQALGGDQCFRQAGGIVQRPKI